MMSKRSISRVLCAFAMSVAFAAWGRSISIESVNRNASGDIESITLGFTADEQPSVLYLAYDAADMGTDRRSWSHIEKVAVVPGTAFATDTQTYTAHSFRVTYATPTDEQLAQGVAILGDLAREMMK